MAEPDAPYRDNHAFKPLFERLKAANPDARPAVRAVEELFSSPTFKSATPPGIPKDLYLKSLLMGFRIVFLDGDEVRGATLISKRMTFLEQINREIAGETADLTAEVLEHPFGDLLATEAAVDMAKESVRKRGLTTLAAVIVHGERADERLELFPEMLFPESFSKVAMQLRAVAIKRGVTPQRADSLEAPLMKRVLRLEPFAIDRLSHVVAQYFLHAARDQQDVFVLE
ncbi:hypothetical protein A3G67_01250 [Candidatus Roizmanbacteria bacterium RIFCSPLOWO2_12_FULL_40_12]|nr:MAG: hypothetical protein A3G67_01250 [Candidatus Roizmanbacteria bacterium RIFCSPLOWO2_12_FULL_40_12]